ncbi:MAG: three-Cys-motif partner protein TcmP [Anaerolineales bacterium]|nr:three-Cys-motif partner protein TcmP [Anaerolineales bacterium]
MTTNQKGLFDEIGYWSELKLEIIKEYAAAYSKILTTREIPFTHVYIDAFAGSGVHLSKQTGDFVPGSPLNALEVKPPFKEIYLIDLDGDKTQQLREYTRNDPRVTIYSGDCNVVLLKEVFSKVKYEDYRRGLCLLDPYGLQLNWEVIEQAGHLKTIDMFLNFPVMDMNRTALWRNPEAVRYGTDRMTSFWGDESWRSAAYKTVPTLFGNWEEKNTNEDIVNAFCERLKKVAKFQYVTNPLPMKNSRGAVVYYLFFASQQQIADHIITNIYEKYR